jgi:hypothetical protein
MVADQTIALDGIHAGKTVTSRSPTGVLTDQNIDGKDSVWRGGGLTRPTVAG